MATTLVNQDTFTDTGSTDPQSFVLTNTPAQGNVLFLMRAVLAATVNINAITQTNVTWTLVKANTTNQYCEIWVGVVGASASKTISVDLTGSSAVVGRYNVSEWSGISANGGAVAAQCLTNSGTGTGPSTATITFPDASNYLLLACVREGGTFTSGPTNSWVALSTPNSGSQFAYKIVTPATASGTDSTAWVFTAALVWGSVVATCLAQIPTTATVAAANLGVAGAGSESIPATGTVALANVGIAATGSEAIPSTGTVALANIGIAGTGSEELSAAGAVAFADLGIAGSGNVVNPTPVPFVPGAYGVGGGSRRRSIEYVKLRPPKPKPVVRATRRPVLSSAETDERTAAIDRQLSVTFRAPSTALSVQEIAEHNANAIALTEQLFADLLDGG